MALFFVFSALAPSGLAAPTTKNDADKAIKTWLKTTERPLNTKLSKEIVDIKEYKNKEGVVLHYVVNLKPEGFVVMSADDLIEPIIAFSPFGTFEPSNPLYEIVQIDLSDRLKKLKDLEAKAKAEKKELTPSGVHKKSKTKWKQLIDDAVQVGALIDEKISDPTVAAALPDSIDDLRVDALVKSKWSQGGEGGSPCYNYYTPSYCVSGCMATAYAQVMRYHQWPTTGVAVVTRSLSVNGVTTPCTTRGGNGSGGPYDWANMTLDPDASITLVQRQAIGALMSDAGIFLGMGYTDGLSTSGFSAGPLINDFHYANAVNSSNTHDYTAEGEFHKILNTNFDAGYPTMLAINGSAGGHAIVCDGYGFNLSTPYHHLNMGWGGGSDGWYNMPNITASYNDVFAVMYNIFPIGNGEIISGRVLSQIGTPAIGVTITITEGANTYTDVTDSKGIYGIRVPSNKTFTVSCPNTIGATVTTGLSGNSTGNRIQNFTQSSGPELFFSHTTFLESPRARGTISNPMVIDVIHDTFTGAIGADVSANISVTNLPVGLSAQFIKISNTQLTCTLNGYAPYHTEAEDLYNLTFTFQNAAFTSGNASLVRHYNRSNFVIDFNNYLCFEDFDLSATFPSNMTDQWVVGSTTARWKIQSGGKLGGVYPAAAHSGAYNATLYVTSRSDNKRRMITPSFSTLGYNNLTFKFWHNQQDWSGDQDTLKVLYSLDDGATWIQLQEYLTSMMNWTEETFTIPTASATTLIAFEGNAKYGFGVNIDDISVTGNPTGEPILQEMHVTRGATAITDGGTDTITPTEGGVGAPVTYKISNIGGLNLTMTTPVTISSPSNCSVVVNTQPGSTVTPGTFTNLVLTVTPTADGPWSANVSIANNDSNENPYNWQIRGTALTTYTVTLNKDGGTGGTTSVEAAFGAAMPTATAPTKAGYVFGGYYSQLNGAGIQYYTNTMASARTWDLTANTTLYAKWTVGTYTVTFNANGGTTSVPTSKTVTYLGTYGTLATTSRVGYSFNGWWTATSGGTQVQTTTTVTNGTNHQIYARWVGTDPEMNLARGASAILDGGTDTVTGAAAGVALPLTYTISSAGTANITLSPTVKSTETNCTVAITTQPASSVAPAGTSNLVLTVTPTAGGPWSFALSIANNDPNENPYNWSVGGMAAFDTTVSFQQNNLPLPLDSYTGVTDTHLLASSTTPDGSNTLLSLNNKLTKERQSLVRFELSSIPSGSTLKSATLQFTENGTGMAGSVDVYQATGTWNADIATWASSSGITGSATPLASGSATMTANRKIDIPLTDCSFIQGWFGPSATNYGFGIKTTAESNNTSVVYLRSSNHSTLGDRPKLTVTYAAPAGNLSTFTVTLNKDGGTSGTNSVNATFGATMPTATAPTKAGYTFGGYYSQINGGGTQYYTTAMASANVWNIAAATTLYAKWTLAFDAWTGGGGSFGTDSNGDGTQDGMAWLLGASNKDVNAASRLPVASSSAGNLNLSFTCLKVANRGSATLKLQVSDDLGISDPWTSQEVVVPDTSGTVNGVVFTISANADPNLINVQASIPGSTGKVFARLMGAP